MKTNYKKKTIKKKLEVIKVPVCCDNCAFFKKEHDNSYKDEEDFTEEACCLCIEANEEYDMRDLTKASYCTYHSRIGYTCKNCSIKLKDCTTMFRVKDCKPVFCGKCIVGEIIYQSQFKKGKVEVTVIRIV